MIETNMKVRKQDVERAIFMYGREGRWGLKSKRCANIIESNVVWKLERWKARPMHAKGAPGGLSDLSAGS